LKRSLLVVSILLSFLALGVGAGPANAAKVKVSLTKVGQKALINKKILKVRVRSARKGRIKVRAFSATFDKRDRFSALTKVARPRFKRKRQLKVVKLRLTRAGVAAVKRCEDRDVRAQAGGRKSAIKPMARQTAGCAPKAIDLSRSDRCDFIAAPTPSLCMTPFPSNWYTRADPSTPTGRRIHFRSDAMPANDAGNPIDAAPYAASDGFSQGQTLLVRVPGLDNPEALARTNPPGLANPSRYEAPNVPIVVINTATGQRHPIWVELDSTASSPHGTMLMIHPLVNFEPATRYIVAMRGLKDSAGRVLGAPMGFRYYRDRLPTVPPDQAAINQRRSHFEDMFKRLRNRGIKRAGLYLAWDFTTASDESNSARALAMRDQAFKALGDERLADREIQGGAPAFTVDSVEENVNEDVARRVSGTFEVPCFLKGGTGGACGPGATLNLDGDGVPARNGTWTANFECVVPHAIVNRPASPGPGDPPADRLGRSLVYGHGLMGSIAGEINASGQRKLAARGFVVCGTDEIGMSVADSLPVIEALKDLSRFPRVADRLQQGLLNEMFLARLMIHPEGLASRAAFRFDPEAPDPAEVPGAPDDPVPGGSALEPVLKTGPQVRAFYRGNSQGGIMGGALTALAPDFDRASLGVAGMNYSVLLTRSAAWQLYGGFFNPAYPDELNRPLALGLIQMLWDRGEPNGYAHRMTSDPLPNTPPHKVLMDIAFGDHLVSNWQGNVQARTIGARAVSPFVSPGRWGSVDGEGGMEAGPSYPFDGSAISYWDSGPERPGPGPNGVIGTSAPPLGNVAPSSGEDPHEHPRVSDVAVGMFDEFLRDGGAVTNPCAPGPCFAGGYTGP